MRVLAALLAVISVQCCDANSESNGPKTRPNIVIVLADDLGWNDVGFNNPDIISPNIDGLATSGIILNQSYVQPLCSPSRAALMTGVYPFRLGLQHYVLLERQATCLPLNRTILPEVLKQNGYATHIVGKWHLGMCNWECTPMFRGFDTHYGFYMAETDYYTKITEGGYDFRDGLDADLSANGTHSGILCAERMKQIIHNHNTSQPLFLYLALQEAHGPLEVPDEFYEMYPNIEDKSRRNFSALVTMMDTTVGKLVQALKDKGLYDNTLIIFSSDNGGAPAVGGNNYPLRGGKGTVFEGGTRAVGFVHGPMFKNVGVRYDGLIHEVDWFDTILDAVDISDTVSDQDGINVWDSLLHLTPTDRDEIVYNLDYSDLPIQGEAAIRVGDYKLIKGYPGMLQDRYNPANVSVYGPIVKEINQVFMFYNTLDPKVVEQAMFGNRSKTDFNYLFNIKDDPEELSNIYNQRPDIVHRLSCRLEFHKSRYVTPNFPADSPESEPSNWCGIWTPGWC